MKKQHLLKSMLLLCALVVGSGSVWAQTTLWSEDFSSYASASYYDKAISGGTYSYSCANGTGTSPGSTIIKNENTGGGAAPELMVGKKGSGTGATGGKFTAVIPLDNIEGTLTLTYYQNKQTLKVSSPTTGVSGGQTLKPSEVGKQTTTFTGITTEMTSITIVFEATTTNNVRLDNIVLTGNKASSVEAPSFSLAAGFYGTAQSVVITTNEAGGTTYYTIDGTSPDNSSTPYTSAISITSTTTLKAVTYNSAGTEHSGVVSATYSIVEDGVFDFVSAGPTGFSYGSGVGIETDGAKYVTDEKTWTAGNVTMVTSGKYRWWYNGYELKMYNNTPASAATFSVPSGYVITKIVTTGGNFVSATNGTLSTNTWTGAANSVKLSISTSTVSFKTITVSYTTANQSITPAKEYTTYVTPYAMDFTGVSNLTAYVATSKNGSNVVMTPVEEVPAKTPLLLKRAAAATFNVPVIASADAITTNYLKAAPAGGKTFTGTETDKYILYDGTFYLVSAGTLAEGKVYLDLEGLGAHSLDIIFEDSGEATGIATVEAMTSVESNKFYNLNGQQVAQPTKGLYIVNGKKVIIK